MPPEYKAFPFDENNDMVEDVVEGCCQRQATAAGDTMDAGRFRSTDSPAMLCVPLPIICDDELNRTLDQSAAEVQRQVTGRRVRCDLRLNATTKSFASIVKEFNELKEEPLIDDRGRLRAAVENSRTRTSTDATQGRRSNAGTGAAAATTATTAADQTPDTLLCAGCHSRMSAALVVGGNGRCCGDAVSVYPWCCFAPCCDCSSKIWSFSKSQIQRGHSFLRTVFARPDVVDGVLPRPVDAAKEPRPPRRVRFDLTSKKRPDNDKAEAES